jgi:hypothetical protein
VYEPAPEVWSLPSLCRPPGDQWLANHHELLTPDEHLLDNNREELVKTLIQNQQYPH